ncbi:von Willebrand factor A domain-containing protein 8, partial [Podochytrium sp. JEL0797]
MQYCDLANREMEYVSLHRDVSAESDLKQRREIVRDGNGVSVEWNDSVVVKAAVEGRCLVIEGIERAERNVLPALNNLLENREMDLEDGRHIIHPSRYDELSKTHSQAEIDNLGLIRCSEKFQVIALGLPIPPFAGNPLDPPFRSRFQARYVPSDLSVRGPEEEKVVRQFKDLIQIVNETNKLDPVSLLTRVWPQSWIGKGLTRDQVGRLGTLVKETVGSLPSRGLANGKNGTYQMGRVGPLAGRSGTASVQFLEVGGDGVVEAGCVMGTAKPKPAHKSYIPTPRQDQIQTVLAQCHVLNQLPCLVGSNGTGKSTAIDRFAETFGYDVETIHVYRDMTARDLIARRGTRQDGSTCWQHAGLVRAAVEGKLAVLDGIEWLSASTIASMQRFFEDGELALPDGRNLVSFQKFEAIMHRCNMSEQELNRREMFRIHPSFRVVAVANIPFTGASAAGLSWLNEETANMFHFIKVNEIEAAEEHAIVVARVNVPDQVLSKLLQFSHKFRDMASHHTPGLSSASHLSTRQLIRIAARVSATGCKPGDLYSAIWSECLTTFLPSLVRKSVEDLLNDVGIEKAMAMESLEITKTDTHVSFGTATVPIFPIPLHDAHSRSLIPTSTTGPSSTTTINTGFFTNPQQTLLLRNMAIDYTLNEHLLLIGNQGVGKNKITDRFLELIQRPREYMQLHRDTTVGALTATPSVEAGRIVMQDSPLLRAVKAGRVVVVDEADKAPVMITAALKSLAEKGEMGLVDGRTIRPLVQKKEGHEDENVIWMHPDFRMIVLANRPGFPFLGNDFFGTIGEAFGVHPIENPEGESECRLLEQAGPDVEKEVIRRLVLVFGELRKA